MATMTIKRVKSTESKVEEQFDAMSWLKSGREWVIGRILEHHSRKDLVEVMTAVKNAVLACDNEDDACEAMDNVILTHNFSMADFSEARARELEARKRTHLG